MARRPYKNNQESLIAAALDKRALYDDIAAQIAPILTQALEEGWTDEKLANHPKIQLMLTARAITVALRDPDGNKAMTAIRDIKDRTKGKPKESLELTGRLAKTPTEQLDAMLKTKLGLSDESEDGDETPH